LIYDLFDLIDSLSSFLQLPVRIFLNLGNYCVDDFDPEENYVVHTMIYASI
jgi:hypothetical protein